VTLRVLHTFGRNAGSVQALQKHVVRFGRAPDNDVVFDPDYDRDASGYHAEVRLDASQWVLIDLESRNGTFVRGQRVRRHPLVSGDEVMFGTKGPRVRLEFDGPSAHGGASGMHGGASGMHGGASGIVGVPPAAIPQAPPAGARVGHRTIAMMIQSAVAVAAGRSRPRKTVEINALVDQQVTAATAGHRRTTYLLGGLLLLAFTSLGGLILWSTQSHDDITKLREELATMPPDDPRRKEVEGRLGTLHPPNASFGRNLYDRTKKGIFMLASGSEGFCTAFAVRPSILATNAHCIYAARSRGGTIVALENEGRGQVRFSVTEMRPHPGYRETDAENVTPDVGIVQIAGRAAVVLEIATAKELATVGAGDDVYLIGFPGRLMDPTNPAATFLAAHVGRITDSSGRPGALTTTWLIQHDASTTKGTSGSPVFNGQGKVIAVNAGGYLEGDQEKIAGRKTEVVKASPYKFAIRIDQLDAILR
jgi:V8-like Glu-specific endopeptidase